ncbi:unnamed protein product [Musa acuminata subsp. malaccensis]|uniref:(wild Malaysian banana) hypothetical protein n=1 Tax=Musa acuminata subsp. malaccensis TaxID=214687 RepID=A0A8D6ZYC5_MUSAM|nr:unnamed protein product [Musa acuminata subsp. malaccensis]
MFLLLFLVVPNLAQSQILFQGFNWESWRQQGGWYNFLKDKVSDIANAGVTHVWLPPPSHSVGIQGRSVIRICRRDHSHMLTESALV